ncbi:glycosyltransferase family 4 protein [bacterium]|nr:glycosyltransferase family 4 protein [bacterium]
MKKRVIKKKKTLLVIIPYRLSELVKKGEITDRYYNPGNLFDDVHILMTNDDVVNPEDVQRMAGHARLYLHNLPSPSFKKTFGWSPFFIRKWTMEGLNLAKGIKPDMVRVINNFIEGYLSKEIKSAIGIPYIISLHGVWDRDCLRTPKERFIRLFRKKFERSSLQNADGVAVVYKSIIRYAKSYGAQNLQLVYNVVAGERIEKKENHRLSMPARLLTINRQEREKNPENIIRAVKDIDCTYLIVGDGQYHEYLKGVAAKAGCERKVEFIKAISNDRLCKMLKEFDIMVSNCDYWGISKTVIEASLAKLPIVLNKHPVEIPPEYKDDWLVLCDNTPEGYKAAILKLIKNESLRNHYGQKAYLYAKANFDPDEMEKRIVRMYEEVIGAKD